MRARSSRGGGSWRAACVACFVLFVAWRAAFAQGEPGSVDIYVVGPDTSLPRFQAALGAIDRPIRWSAIDKLDVGQITERPSEDGGALRARVWVDGSDPTRVRLYFADWSSERFLLRDVPTPDGFTPVSLETIAQMIETSLSALTSDRTAGMTRVEMGRALGDKAAPPPPRPPRAEAPPSPSIAGVLGAFYAAQAFAKDWPIEEGPGIAAELRQAAGAARLGGWLTAQYQLPATIDDALVGVRVETLAIRAGVEIGTPIGGDVVVLGRIGVGGDAIHVAPRPAAAANAVLAEEKFYWDTMVQLASGIQVRLNSHLELDAAILVDVDFVLRHYDVEVAGATTRLATPWSVRPGLLAGLSWR